MRYTVIRYVTVSGADAGAGYRIYYTIVANRVVLLLAAGSKRTQAGDIRRAIRNLPAYEPHQ